MSLFSKKLLKQLEDSEITVEETDGCISFYKYSPEGQDFSFAVSSASSLNEVVDNITEFYDNYDVSEETMLWLDENGHGKNGAPYDMKDVYEDMAACKEIVAEVANEISKFIRTKESK